MDILSDLPLESSEDFSIAVNNIESGWMDLVIATSEKRFQYSASYLTDPLNDLLEATVLLLTKQSCHSRFGRLFKHSAMVVHDLEGNMIVWLLHYSDDIFTVVIWKDIDTGLIEDLCSYNLDKATYEKKTFEDLPDLTNNLLFALKGSPESFAKTLTATFDNLGAKFPDEEDRDHWGFSYSKTKFQALKKWLQNK